MTKSNDTGRRDGMASPVAMNRRQLMQRAALLGLANQLDVLVDRFFFVHVDGLVAVRFVVRLDEPDGNFAVHDTFQTT